MCRSFRHIPLFNIYRKKHFQVKTNYQALMENEFEKIESTGKKPVLLLQCCCAPCSSAFIERLREHFTVKLYFYNPNIYPEAEYQKRLEQFDKLLSDGFGEGIEQVAAKYDQAEFFDFVKGLENEKEGGARCAKCFILRLRETARKAKEIGADYFCTTLTVSPHKNAEVINNIGMKLQEEYGVKYLLSDFKKKEGYKRSTELSKQFDLYRQNYCGCKFSMWFDEENSDNK